MKCVAKDDVGFIPILNWDIFPYETREWFRPPTTGGSAGFCNRSRGCGRLCVCCHPGAGKPVGRKRLGITQVEAARILGYRSRRQIGEIERCGRNPAWEKIFIAIATENARATSVKDATE